MCRVYLDFNFILQLFPTLCVYHFYNTPYFHFCNINPDDVNNVCGIFTSGKVVTHKVWFELVQYKESFVFYLVGDTMCPLRNLTHSFVCICYSEWDVHSTHISCVCTHTSTAIGDPPVVIMVGHKLVKEAVSGPSIQLTPPHIQHPPPPYTTPSTTLVS